MIKCCENCMENARKAEEYRQRYVDLAILTRSYERSANGYVQLGKYIEDLIEKYGDKKKKRTYNLTVYNELLYIASQIEKIDFESFEGMGKND